MNPLPQFSCQHVKDKLKAELNRLVEENVIAPVDTPTTWIPALVVTAQKNGGHIRLCIDPKLLNRALKPIHYPSPTIDDILRTWPMLAVFQSYSTAKK